MKRLISFFIIIFLLFIFASHRLLSHHTFSRQTTHQTPTPTTRITQTQFTQAIHISTGQTPNIPLTLPNGFTIHVFAKNLGNPRDEVFSSGGTLLVSSPDKGVVYALPDVNHDGVADTTKTIITGENHPHGLAFYNNQLFVADVDKVVRYNWDENTLTATKDKILFSLPENNDHNSRTITFDSSGNMYVSVGSTCNVCHEASVFSATVLISNSNGDNPRVFATGLRNASFITMNPKTHELWGTEMGRDYLVDTTPPDEIDIIQHGNNYGWPYCYGDKVHDNNFDPNNTHSCENTISPIFQITAHSAPLGLVFINSQQFPSDEQGDLLVSYHGSWNRSTPIGYKVVHLKVSGNTITNSEDFLTGFTPTSTPNSPGNSNNTAPGRPVDLIFDSSGNLYLSDDKAGVIYIIQKSS